MNTVKWCAMNDGVILEWGCGLCVKRQDSLKRLYIGETQMMVRGQFIKIPGQRKKQRS